jgi:predicted lipoprotein with Yx(FWY)xxD motif
MKTSSVAWALIIVIILAGVWVFSTRTAAAPIETATSTEQSDTGVAQQPGADGQEDAVIGSNLALGLDGTASTKHLIGYNGMTVYMNAQDMTSASTCYDSCAVTWMPYIVSPVDNIHQLQAGVTDDVGTSTRTDGQIQLTYNGHPLYFYKGDTASSDTKGNGVGNGQWAMVQI